LSDNYLKQSQINTVVVQQKDMDRVGLFEPTTSAPQPYCFLRSGLYTYYLSTTVSYVQRKLSVQTRTVHF
jgi:hypothetical protein